MEHPKQCRRDSGASILGLTARELDEHPLVLTALILAALLGLWACLGCARVDPVDPEGLTAPQRRILDAIQLVETGNLDPVNSAGGDQGKALGPFQIHRSYWQDSTCKNPQISFCYEQIVNAACGRRVVRAYMQRWCPQAWERADAQIIARVHNGGPRGADNARTLVYWNKVKARLDAP